MKFDTAAVYDKYIGETEKRIQKVFKVAEGLAPCVLWIDELEKVFAGSGPDSASADAGVSSRLLASFLSWMQDRKAPVFVAATCNNVTVLPPELIRKGRFDELFFVDLPNAAERKQIFSIQLTKRKRNPADYDLDRVAAAAKGFSGAEIESAVQTALYAAFCAQAGTEQRGPAHRAFLHRAAFHHPRRRNCHAAGVGERSGGVGGVARGQALNRVSGSQRVNRRVWSNQVRSRAQTCFQQLASGLRLMG